MVNWPIAWQPPERSLPVQSPVIVLFSTSPFRVMPSWFGGPVKMLIPNDELFLKPPSNSAVTPTGDSTAHGGVTVIVKFVTVTAEVLLCFNEVVKAKKEVVPSEYRRTPDQLPSIVGLLEPLEPPHPTSRANAKRSPTRFIKAPFAKHACRKQAFTLKTPAMTSFWTFAATSVGHRQESARQAPLCKPRL